MGLVWLDYTKSGDVWPQQNAWVSTLATQLTVHLDPLYTTDIGWTGWRLPATVDGPCEWSYDGTTNAGYYITSSEMGHLFYTSLGNQGDRDANGHQQSPSGIENTGPFENLQRDFYWSGTPYNHPNHPSVSHHWGFSFDQGHQTISPDYMAGFSALAVHPGTVSLVPVPGAGMLGLLGLGSTGAWLKRRRMR